MTLTGNTTTEILNQREINMETQNTTGDSKNPLMGETKKVYPPYNFAGCKKENGNGNKDFVTKEQGGKLEHVKLEPEVNDKDESGKSADNHQNDTDSYTHPKSPDASSTPSDEGEVDMDPIDHIIKAVEKEVEEKTNEQEKLEEIAGTRRPKRASAKKARSNIAVMNRLVENNPFIKELPRHKEELADEHTDFRPMQKGSHIFIPRKERGIATNRQGSDKEKKQQESEKKEDTLLERWGTIEKPADIPNLMAESPYIRQLRQRILMRQSITQDTEVDPNVFRCRHCDSTFDEISTLFSHIASVHSSVAHYRCDQCGDQFRTAAEYEDHTPAHSLRYTEGLITIVSFKRRENMLFKCPLQDCLSRPLSWGMFINHMHFHWASDCLLCGERLCPNDITAFTTHMSLHIPDGPFACPYCPFLPFPDMSSLKRHLLIQHGAGRTEWRCRFCKATFSKFANLDLHLLKVHTNRPYVCQYCGYEFSSIVILEDHMKIHKVRGADHDKKSGRKLAALKPSKNEGTKRVANKPLILRKKSSTTPPAALPTPQQIASNFLKHSVGQTIQNGVAIPLANLGNMNIQPEQLYILKGIDGKQQIVRLVKDQKSAAKPVPLVQKVASLGNSPIILPGIQKGSGVQQLVQHDARSTGPVIVVSNNVTQNQVVQQISAQSLSKHSSAPQSIGDFALKSVFPETGTLAANKNPNLHTANIGTMLDQHGAGLKITDVRSASEIEDHGEESDNNVTTDENQETSSGSFGPIVIAPIQENTCDGKSSGTNTEKSSELVVCPFPQCLTVSPSANDLWISHYYPQHFNKSQSFEFMCGKCAGLYTNVEWPPANHSCSNASWIHICCDCGLLFENQYQKHQHYTQCKKFVDEEMIIMADTAVDPLACKYCPSEGFSSVVMLSKHMLASHPSHRFYYPLIACEQCTEIRRFLKVEHLWAHYKVMHNEWWRNCGVYLCTTCGCDHTTILEYNEHQVYSHGLYKAPRLLCTDCSRICISSAEIIAHKKAEHGKVFSCVTEKMPLENLGHESNDHATPTHPSDEVIQERISSSGGAISHKVFHSTILSTDVSQRADSTENVQIQSVHQNGNNIVTSQPSVGKPTTVKGRLERIDVVKLREKTKEIESEDKDSGEAVSDDLNRVQDSSSSEEDEISDESDSESLWQCEKVFCQKFFDDFESLRDHVRLTHDVEKRLLNCPCPEQPPLSTRKLVHRYWQHVVNVHPDWLATFKFSCSVCGELFRKKKEFEIHQIYQHKMDVGCIRTSKCIEIVNRIQKLKDKNMEKKSEDSEGSKEEDKNKTISFSSEAKFTLISEGVEVQPEKEVEDKRQDIITLSSEDEENEPKKAKKNEQSNVKKYQSPNYLPLITDQKIKTMPQASDTKENDNKVEKTNEPITLDSDEDDEKDSGKITHTTKFKCDKCGKYLPSAVSLRKHEKLVHPVGMIKCEKCKLRFPVGEIKSHICGGDPTLKPKYHCEFCSEKFLLVSNKNKHVASVHRNELKRCKICNKAFISKGTLDKHYQTKHPVVSNPVVSNPVVSNPVVSNPVLSTKSTSAKPSITMQENATKIIELSNKQSEEVPRESHKTVRELLDEKRKGQSEPRVLQSLLESPKPATVQKVLEVPKPASNFGNKAPVMHQLYFKKCKYCNKQVATWTGQESHEDKCTHNPFRCYICGKKFESPSVREVHLKVIHSVTTEFTPPEEEDKEEAIVIEETNPNKKSAAPTLAGTNVITISTPNIISNMSNNVISEEELLKVLDEEPDDGEEEEMDDTPSSFPQEKRQGNSLSKDTRTKVISSESEGEETKKSGKGRIISLMRGGDSSDEDECYTEVHNTSKSPLASPEKQSSVTSFPSSRKRKNIDDTYPAIKDKEAILDEVFGPKKPRRVDSDHDDRDEVNEAAKRKALEDAVFGPKKISQAVIDEVFGSKSTLSQPASVLPGSSDSSEAAARGIQSIVESNTRNTISQDNYYYPEDQSSSALPPSTTSEGWLEIAPSSTTDETFHRSGGGNSQTCIEIAPEGSSHPTPINIFPDSDQNQGKNLDYQCDVCYEKFELECYLDIHKLNKQHF